MYKLSSLMYTACVRPLTHPPLEAITVEGILYALSDPLRLAIYVNLSRSECPQACSKYLNIKGIDLPKSTLSQHFKVLRDCGLVRSEKRGVEILNTTRCKELGERFGSLVGAILTAYDAQEGSTKKKR